MFQLHALKEGCWRRLVEKLAEQKHSTEAKIGNTTCVRELNVLNASHNIDVQAMKRDAPKCSMPSEWFKKYEHLLNICYKMATNLPADIANNAVVIGDAFNTVKLGEVKRFTKCCKRPEPNYACTRTSRTKLSPTLLP